MSDHLLESFSLASILAEQGVHHQEGLLSQNDWLKTAQSHHHETRDCKPRGRAVLLGSFTLLLSTRVLFPNTHTLTHDTDIRGARTGLTSKCCLGREVLFLAPLPYSHILASPKEFTAVSKTTRVFPSFFLILRKMFITMTCFSLI